MQLDAKALADATAEIVKTHVAAAAAPLLRRIEALEQRPAPEKGDKGDSVKGDTGVGVMGAVIDRDGVLVLTLSDGTTRDLGEVVGKNGDPGPPPDEDAVRSALQETVKGLVVEEVVAAMAELPSTGQGDLGEAVVPDAIKALVEGKVGEAVAALPVPQDGKSITLEDVAPLIAEAVGKAVDSIPPPLGVRSVVLDRDGNAVFTYSDGSTQNVGRVVGRDGQDADMPGLEKQLLELVDAIPKPKDGRDGFDLEAFDVEAGEDGRTVTLTFQQGDVRHSYELVFPVMIDRGVFKADREEAYQPGDTVTWGGSLWTAQRETKAKPDGPDSGWRLSVKKGRDGKDAKAA